MTQRPGIPFADLCPREAETEAAVRQDRWDDDLRGHVAACSICRDVVAVGEYLRQQADEVFGAAVPDADVIWWKAQLMARQEAARKAARPIAVVESAACACGLLVGVAALVWAAPFVKEEAAAAATSFMKVMGSAAVTGALAGLGAAVMSVYALLSLASLRRPAKR